MDKIRIITPPDILFDRSKSILVVCPDADLKDRLQAFLLNSKEGYNIYIFTEHDDDIKWLLTLVRSVNYTIINVDGITDLARHFLSYMLSYPTTYYKSNHNAAPWELLNLNKFYDFPNFESEIE